MQSYCIVFQPINGFPYKHLLSLFYTWDRSFTKVPKFHCFNNSWEQSWTFYSQTVFLSTIRSRGSAPGIIFHQFVRHYLPPCSSDTFFSKNERSISTLIEKYDLETDYSFTRGAPHQKVVWWNPIAHLQHFLALTRWFLTSSCNSSSSKCRKSSFVFNRRLTCLWKTGWRFHSLFCSILPDYFFTISRRKSRCSAIMSDHSLPSLVNIDFGL